MSGGTTRRIESSPAALGAAHRAGIVHRDVEPENVFFEAAGDGFGVELLDFGFARPLAEEPGLTGDGTSVGTPAYMSPGQVQGLAVDGRSDL